MNQTPKYVGTQVYLAVYSHLIVAAQQRERLTYQAIAKLMGLPPSGNHMGKEIGIMLGEITEVEHAHGRPMLSALVVNTSGQPGPGFFILGQQLGLYSGTTRAEEVEFWHTEEAKVYASWDMAAVAAR